MNDIAMMKFKETHVKEICKKCHVTTTKSKFWLLSEIEKYHLTDADIENDWEKNWWGKGWPCRFPWNCQFTLEHLVKTQPKGNLE